MIDHALPVRELSLVQEPATDDLLTPERRRHARRGYRLGQSERPGTVDLTAVTLETECGSPPKLEERRWVVSIRTNFAAIPEFRFPLLTRRAQGPGTL